MAAENIGNVTAPSIPLTINTSGNGSVASGNSSVNVSVKDTRVIPKITKNVSIPGPVVPNGTPTPEADPADVSRIKFSQYSDEDFSIDYPSTWKVTTQTYIPYFCQNNVDISSSDYHVCYQNETAKIGPFIFYETYYTKKPARIVTFTSADGKLKFVSFTKDFIDSVTGNLMLNPTSEWSRELFNSDYPDVAASNAMGNFKYFASGNSMASSYDVIMPKDSKYYPLAYTMKNVVTVHHLYSFVFITNIENFSKYTDLKEWIIGSIITNDAS
jgi:hypothetical protein